jgi:hypothetical protein
MFSLEEIKGFTIGTIDIKNSNVSILFSSYQRLMFGLKRSSKPFRENGHADEGRSQVAMRLRFCQCGMLFRPSRYANQKARTRQTSNSSQLSELSLKSLFTKDSLGRLMQIPFDKWNRLIPLVRNERICFSLDSSTCDSYS